MYLTAYFGFLKELSNHFWIIHSLSDVRALWQATENHFGEFTIRNVFYLKVWYRLVKATRKNIVFA